MTNEVQRSKQIALIGDVGGTNARFALADLSGVRPTIRQVRIRPSHDFKQATDAVSAYLDEVGERPALAAIAAAGPVESGAVHFTNLNWTLAERDFRALGFSAARVVNDFVALALATPLLRADDFHSLGGAKPDGSKTVAVIGPGTGFGASALVRGARGESVAMASEGGHASFAPGDDTEIEILRVLAKKFGHVSIERVLSGPGLANIHAALTGDVDAKPEEITKKALSGEAPFTQSLDRFCTILGSVAGDFALAYGATGGVFVAGGIAPAILPVLEKSAFRTRFESKGRFDHYLHGIATSIVTHTDLAFLGAAAVAQTLAAQT